MKKYAEDYTISEMMAAVCSLQINNDDVAFVGVGIPLMAGAVAAATHAPDVIIVYEGEALEPRAEGCPGPFRCADHRQCLGGNRHAPSFQ